MASLRDAEQLTKELESLVGDLKSEIRGGKGDFEKLTQLADQVSERADEIAETFSSMNDVLMEKIGAGGGTSGSRSRQSNGGSREKAASQS